MKKILFYILLLSLSTVFLLGCDQSGDAKTDSPVIAKVDNAVITEDDFINAISRVPEWARSQFTDKEGKMKFLDELIKRELIYQNAKKMRLNKDKDYVAKVEEFKKMTLLSLIINKEVEQKARVDDAEIKAFFDENKDKFTVGTQVRASHILVETEKEAKDILERIGKGESFAALAKSLSKDKGSAEKGGDLGYFGRGKMVPEFEKAALALKPGEISDPVRTRFGYHIIKLTDIKKGKPADFEQTKESIRKQLIMQKKKELFDAYVEKLKTESNITKDEDVVAAIPLPWEAAEESGAGAGQQEQSEAE